jgi:superfamily II DNA or RNA helicase
MKINVFPSYFLLDASKELLDQIHNKFSYRDKAVEYKLNKLTRSLEWRQRNGLYFPGYEEWKEEKLIEIKELQGKLDVFCCEFEGESLKIPIGILDAVKEDIRSQDFLLTDHREFSLPRRHLTGFCPPLRAPQIEAIKIALQKPIGTIEMATGTGKTLVGSEIIRHYGVKSIFLVPSRAILNQTVNRFRAAFGSRHIGKVGDGKKKHSHVTVATYQSVYAGDKEDFLDYDLVICDEAHHVPAETYYEVVENRLKNAVYRYGLSADIERIDGGTILVEAATGPIVYSYPAPQAIRDGFLAKPTFVIYEITRTQGSYIKWITNNKDERVADGLVVSEAFTEDDSHLAYKNWILGNDLLTQTVSDIAAGFKNNGMSVLILVDEKEHGDKLMGHLKSHGARFAIGGGKDNEKLQFDFNQRELKILIATSVLGEGADTVPVDVLINLMGGTKVKQANGRALRNDPDENGIPRKPQCIIIDFDVPVSPVLHRHSKLREQVHQSCGPVYRRTLI